MERSPPESVAFTVEETLTVLFRGLILGADALPDQHPARPAIDDAIALITARLFNPEEE